ncbi:RecE family exodeoxyribonuclease [Citrobacter freundii]|uniref:RecE family exodeoxyribonuclease n=1 Tax=Citrobacter freundii TaxID=546 RepID=UPI001BCC0108|nr:RecE family exodeoxyribonuclease [Citrobacter freundii]
MEFFNVVKATQKSGKQDAVIWFTAKTEARANLMLDVALEDAGIETGRGKDYAKPIRTDFPVVDDLPEEGEVDFTWCDRYELAEDQRTWNVKLKADNAAQEENHQADDNVVDGETGHTEESQQEEQPNLIVVATLPFRQRVLAQFIGDGEYLYHIDAGQKNEIVRLEMDTDDTYIQNLLLAAENVEAFKKAIEHDIHKVVNAVKKVFPVDGKKTELATVIQFLTVWFNNDYIDRGILAREWAAGNRISNVQRTDSGTNADGGYVTDRGEGARHTLDTLDLEIACALLPMDFNHLEIPGSIHRRAKEIVANKEQPWKSWSSILRNQPGVLSVNRAAIFNLVRIAPENIHLTPVAHLEFVNQIMTAEFNSATELMPLPAAQPETEPQTAEEHRLPKWAEAGEQQLADEDEAETQTLPKWANAAGSQPQVENLGGGVFSIDGLMGDQQPKTDDRSPVKEETTSDVQMEETVSDEDQAGNEVQSGESSLETGEESHTGQQADVNQNADSVSQTSDSVNQTDPLATQTEPETQSDEPAVVYPAYFEPGRYEGLPNEVYHAANGISSTQVKDARVSLMYFNARHVEKTIIKERSPVLDMGNLVHALALQPEQLDEEFSVEPLIPEGAFTTTATIRAFIDEHNASLPAQLSADDIKTLLEEYNATLPAQVPLGDSLEETGQSYMSLPEEYQRIEADQKQTATAMKACIKEYNATLPAQVKTSGSRDALLEQLAIINPDLVAQEVQKPQPLKVSGTKADLIQAVKSVNPDAVFTDELLDAWRENPQGKVLVTRQQLNTALAIQKSLLQHPTAGMLLQHPSRAVEVSYFGFDDETGLEVRVRPDLEIDLDGVRIGADLKTISMWNIKQEGLRAKLHREIIDRDYHLSAAMYCETAALDQFFWIFVNKDENYHWIAIIEASAELLELGMLEYRKAMRAIATGYDTGEWPAPITADYTDELNDFDLRRLETLRLA